MRAWLLYSPLILHIGAVVGVYFSYIYNICIRLLYSFGLQVRWGLPGFQCTISVLGPLQDPRAHPAVNAMLPWSAVTVVAELGPDDASTLTLTTFQGSYSSEPSRFVGQPPFTSCQPLHVEPHPFPTGLSASVCITMTSSILVYGGMWGLVSFNASLNTTWASGPSNDVIWSAPVALDGLDCRMQSAHMAGIIVTLVICIAAPFILFFWCPIPTAHRTSVTPRGAAHEDWVHHLRLGDLRMPSRARRFFHKLYLASHDATVWGGLTYFIASLLYVHARQSPDYLAAHPQYKNIMYIIAAALYVHSAVFYHVSWEGSPIRPLAVDLWESYLNIIGASGFVVSAVMYLWADFDSVGRPTTGVEMVFYALWLLEEVFNGWAAADWWTMEHAPLCGRSVRQYCSWLCEVLTSITFWANAFSAFGSTLYLASTILLFAQTVSDSEPVGGSAFVRYWEGLGLEPPTQQVRKPPNLNIIQGFADYCYLLDSIVYVWSSWLTFDVQLSNEPLPKLPLPDGSPTSDRVRHRPDSPSEEPTDAETADEPVLSHANEEWDGRRVSAETATSATSLARDGQSDIETFEYDGASPNSRYSIRAECMSHLLCGLACKRRPAGRVRRFHRAVSPASQTPSVVLNPLSDVSAGLELGMMSTIRERGRSI